MRKKAVITSGVAAAVLGGGLVLALNGGGTASAERTAVERPAAAASPSVRSIGRAEAEQVALAAVLGGRVRSAERETEHGVPVWSVRVVKDGVTHDLDIDARTGKVLRDRADRRAPAGRRHDDARAAEPPARPDSGRTAAGRPRPGTAPTTPRTTTGAAEVRTTPPVTTTGGTAEARTTAGATTATGATTADVPATTGPPRETAAGSRHLRHRRQAAHGLPRRHCSRPATAPAWSAGRAEGGCNHAGARLGGRGGVVPAAAAV